MAVPTRVRPVEAEESLGGRYEVLSSIGDGAAAWVFRVRDVRTGATRAAKVLKPEKAANAETLARFEDEFRILRTLHHPHLPEVYDYGATADGGRFLIMEIVDGAPVDEYFRAHPEDIWTILYELCETLVFVHARNLLHQDIKPSNILVTRTPVAGGERPLVKLIDFGLTYRRGTGARVRLVGTPGYIAPEVVRGEKTLNRAVDYYSLGATLYELLCGKAPFMGSESEVLHAHLDQEPVIEREELEWAELYPHVRALLAKDPQARLIAFEEFRRAIVGRLTGGIEDLDRSYALARIDSLGVIGKKDASDELAVWLSALGAGDAAPLARTVSISGGEGVGKRYLIGTLRAEAAARGLRTLTPAEIVDRRADMAVARQPSLMWARLLELCEQEPVILVVERPETLPDEEQSFVRLAGTQWELTRSRGRVLPLFFLVAVDSTTDDADVLDYLPTESVKKIEMSPLNAEERESIVTEFRGAMFDTRDARALSTYLGRFEDVGSAIQGLQQAVLRSALTFAGQRWKAQPSLLSEITATRRDESYSRDLVASLSPLEQRIAAVVAAHPQPVPLEWVSAFVDSDPATILSIVGGSMKRLSVASSEHIAPSSSTIREALRSGCDVDDMRRAHEFLVSHLMTIEPRSVVEERALAYHYEQLGSVRNAARVHIRLLRTYWAVRPRERPYELIEGVCRSGLELLATHGGTVTAPSRRHLFCFYLKEWIKALWARNLFTQAKGIIDEWTERLGETMPASVAPRYVRAVLELEGPEAALNALVRLSDDHSGHAQFKIRLELERSLAFHQAGEYDRAFEVLSAIESSEQLSVRDRYRMAIYRSMHLGEIGCDQEAIELITPLISPAWRDQCPDESLLMQALVARNLLSKGLTASSLAAAARGLRLALGSGLNFRANLMYRLAASAYGEMNDFRRLRHCHERAIQLADAIGNRDIAGLSWGRLANSERMMGRYGNAIRYYERALAMLGERGPAWSRMQTHVSLYGVLVLMNSDQRARKAIDLKRRMKGIKEHNAIGFFHCWRGLHLERDNNESGALQEYRRGRKHFEITGYRSNVAWALSRELRVGIRQDVTRTAGLMRRLESEVAKAGSTEATFEATILKLQACYLLRKSWSHVSPLAKQCEAFLMADQHASLCIEALQILFRIYVRAGRVQEGKDAFNRYRELVTEMFANVNSDQTEGLTVAVGLGEMMDEFKKIARAAGGVGTLLSQGPQPN